MRSKAREGSPRLQGREFQQEVGGQVSDAVEIREGKNTEKGQWIWKPLGSLGEPF